MADISFKNPLVILPTIGGVSIDYTERINKTYSNLITENPVEGSTSSSDYVIRKPVVINFVGEFTDFPSSNVLGAYTSYKSLSLIKFTALNVLADKGETFEVVDGLKTFPSMQFETLQEIKEDDEFKIRFSATLREIIKEDATNTADTDELNGRYAFIIPEKIGVGALALLGTTIDSLL